LGFASILPPLQTIKLGKLDLRVDGEIVFVAEPRIFFTRGESALLLNLLSRPDRVVTASSLCVKTWGHDSKTRRQNLHVYMGRLRRALHPVAGRRVIVTVPRRGYILRSA
jgi:DNA-binding response OmpR family regulator